LSHALLGVGRRDVYELSLKHGFRFFSVVCTIVYPLFLLFFSPSGASFSYVIFPGYRFVDILCSPDSCFCCRFFPRVLIYYVGTVVFVLLFCSSPRWPFLFMCIFSRATGFLTCFFPPRIATCELLVFSPGGPQMVKTRFQRFKTGLSRMPLDSGVHI
jgi:hypothetical protein